MRYATLCSGIEACSVAWRPLGFEPAFFSEIEPFPKAVLKHHYPNVPDLGDMNLYKQWKDDRTIQLICAGTPCQAFSVAGLREGLADPRGNLTLVFLGVLAKYRPRWVVWENVPGVLSDKSNAFGQFVAGLSELGYGVAWRVLDAQYFGVAQRRRRVFVVGCLGDWRASASVLLDPHSLSWSPAPSRGEGEKHTEPPEGGDCFGGIQEVSNAVTSKWHKGYGGPSGQETGNMVISKRPTYYESHPNDSRVTGPHEIGNSVTSRWGTGGGNTPIVTTEFSVRRITPTEAERLQGFPDGYTNIPWNKKDTSPDSHRYIAIGNSIATPVIRWIGERIKDVNDRIEANQHTHKQNHDQD
jgi:DNA (cytosine-5)-methyltransferase 1